MIRLSDRLRVIADEIGQGETVADIGTDHGLLPIFLYECGRSPKVILCDINRGPLGKAKGNIVRYLGEGALVRREETLADSDEGAPGGFGEGLLGGLGKGGLELRLGSGLKPLRSGETDAVVIAGMGGILMADILGEDLNHSRSFSRLVLQPRNKSAFLRRWLLENGFAITAEHLVVERKYICEVITARPKDDRMVEMSEQGRLPEEIERGPVLQDAGNADAEENAGSDAGADPRSDADVDLEISPLLYQNRDPLLIPFLENKIRIEENIVRFVAEGSGEGVDHRRIAQAKERLSALHKKLAQARTLNKGGTNQ